MKKGVFMGDSLVRIRKFPLSVRQDAGFQLDNIQRGDYPDDWKPMKTVGKGVKEIRFREASGHYRVVYLANREESVYVLHVFQKKTRRTGKSDIELARNRLREIGV